MARRIRGVSGRFQKRKAKKSRGKIPLKVLEARLGSLVRKVKARGGSLTKAPDISWASAGRPKTRRKRRK